LTEVVTAVEALFEKGGQIEPRRFTWQETWLDVEGLGRRWIDGGERCFNVMAAGGRMFELRFDPASLRWSVTSGPSSAVVV